MRRPKPHDPERLKALRTIWWDVARGGAFDTLRERGCYFAHEPFDPGPLVPTGPMAISTDAAVRTVGFVLERFTTQNGRKRYRIVAEHMEIYNGPRDGWE